MKRAHQYIVAIDQGTTSTRALVLDTSARIVGASQGSFRIPAIYPRPGWVEFDPWVMWATVRDAITSAVQHANIDMDDIVGLGMANQGETVIAFDADTGAPFGHAISWQDRRTEDVVAAWRDQGLDAEVGAITGLRLESYFSAAKWRWILDNHAGAAAAHERGRLRLGTSDTWLLWQLTGGRAFITDAATASRTMLLDLAKGSWSASLARSLGIDQHTLPTIVASAGLLGVTEKKRFGRELPITGLCVDQHAALFGHGCRAPGQAKVTYGTGCFFLANAGPSAAVRGQGLLTALGWRLGQATHYILEGGVYSAGSMVEWLISLGLVSSPSELDVLAASIEDTRGVIMIPAFSGLAAPYWKSQARAVWAGMDSGTGRAHLVRAAIESIAYRVRDIFDAMRDAGVRVEALRVDGGLSQSRFLMQHQAHVLDASVLVSRSPEVTALGVGLMAGLGAGIWQSIDELPEVADPGERYDPGLEETARALSWYRSWRAICEDVARWT